MAQALTPIVGAAAAGFIASAATTIAVSVATSYALSALQSPIQNEGSSLTNSNITSSAEGGSVLELFGEYRLGGNLIWSTKFLERVTSSSEGGKGGGPEVETTTYSYSVSCAVAFCTGEVDELISIYMDGNEVNLEDLNYSFYFGTDSQNPDPAIETSEGVGTVPAYRGICYIVFEDLQLADYGNRIPQITATLYKSFGTDEGDQRDKSLSALLGTLFEFGNITGEDLITEGLNEIEVDGYLASGYDTPRSYVEFLANFYNLDVRESNGAMKITLKLNPVEWDVPADDLVVSQDNPTGVAILRKQVEDMPSHKIVSFADAGKEYSTATVTSDTVQGQPDNSTSISFPLVTTSSKAQNLANILLREDWAARETIEFALPLNYRGIEVGDVVNLKLLTGTYPFKVATRELGKAVTLQCSGTNTQVYLKQDFADSTGLADVTYESTPIDLEILEFPLLANETDENFQPKLSAWQDPWWGGANIHKSDGSGGYSLNTQVYFPSIVGETTKVFHFGVHNTWDRANDLTVSLNNSNESLSSLSEASVLNGANLVALRTPSGEYEMLQFSSATLNSDGTYTLRDLLRGRLGTEHLIQDSLPIGSFFILVEPSKLGNLKMTTDQIGLPQDLRYGPFNANIDEDLYQDVEFTATGRAFQPYSPVQLKTRVVGGDLELTWTRRTRYSGDSWFATEVPLNEESERYELVIQDSDGITVVRNVDVRNSSEYLYTSNQQIEDFGTQLDKVSWGVSQVSSTYGKGVTSYVNNT